VDGSVSSSRRNIAQISYKQAATGETCSPKPSRHHFIREIRSGRVRRQNLNREDVRINDGVQVTRSRILRGVLPSLALNLGLATTNSHVSATRAASTAIGNVDQYNLDPEQGADNEVETFRPAESKAEARFEYPRVWKMTKAEINNEGSMKNWILLKEPISDNAVFSRIDISSFPVSETSVSDFGRPESDRYIQIITRDDEELKQADLMGVDIRVDENGAKYYDYKLAFSPKKCSYEESKYSWGTCPIKTLAYVSTTVVEGRLFRFIARTNLDQWGNFAKQQPAVWKSFRVAAVAT